MAHPMKQYEVLVWASSFLKEHGREEQVAEILLQHHLQVSRAAFYMQMRDPVNEAICATFFRDVKKHVETGVPVQHIIGTAPFYGRDFIVNSSVLIPRFDTEVLIAHVLDDLKACADPSRLVVADIGTGSGIIAITLKLEMPALKVYATDISDEAIQVAKRNAQKHGADIDFLQGNFLEPIIQKEPAVHTIISNPPYINYQDNKRLADTVKEYDPALALYADREGLAAYQEIIAQSVELDSSHLDRIFFEIGSEQSAAVTELIRDTYPQSHVKTYQDLNERDRVVHAIL